MGGGSWSDDDFKKSVRGDKAFEFSRDTLSKPRDEQRVHQLLDPFGLKVRESRDSAEHPESNAVVVGLDVTGSMEAVVIGIQSALGNLMDMLLKNGYVSDPQLLFYAVGDATCDRIPLQVSQFESDNRINDQLTKVVIEQGGGGQMTESYELGFYVAARHTALDCLEKRGRKGYLFTIGDEMAYGAVSKREVKKLLDSAPEANVPVEAIVREAQVKYHTFHIVPRGSNHYNNPEIRSFWAKLLGGEEFVLMLERPEATADTIAVAIGLNEGAVSFEEALAEVAKKSGQANATAVRKALAEFAATVADRPKKAKSGKKAPKGKDKKEDWDV